MELSKLQQEIIDAPYNKIIILASAASGKTKVMTEKVRQLLRNNIDPREIAVITFTNMAAAELKQRLGDDYKPGLFVGTIHSLANYFLTSAGIKTETILDDENFDQLFLMVKENPSCVKHLEWILLDEAQDSDDLQFEFLLDMIKPECFFICGDIKQCIYRFNGSNPELLQDLTFNPEVYTCDLNENYRNGSTILDFARRLIKKTGLRDTSKPMRGISGTVKEAKFNERTILEYIQSRPPYSQWAILCRSNRQVEQVCWILRQHQIPYETFKQGDLKKEELVEKMQQETVKVLTVHSAKGLEWNNVIAIGMNGRNDEETCIEYVAATRAKNLLVWMK